MGNSIAVEATRELTYYYVQAGLAQPQRFVIPKGKPIDFPVELLEQLRKAPKSIVDGKCPIERDFDAGFLHPVRGERANGILEGLLRPKADFIEQAPLQAYVETKTATGDEQKANEAAAAAAKGVDPDSPPAPVVGPNRNGRRS